MYYIIVKKKGYPLIMKKLISYIFPVYNEQDNIPLLYETITKLLAQNEKYDYELLFINDGSKDDSFEALARLQAKDKRVVILDFSRNFGHQIAVTAGLDHAKGAAIIIMDSDLQDPPAVSFELIKKWEEGYDVVYAQRRSRKDTPFKKLTASIFYRLLRRLADIDIPRNTGDFRLIDRKVVDELKKFKEHSRFLRGMVSYVGFKQVAVQFDRDERHAGVTGYPFKKMVRFAADGIFSFSVYPLKLIRNIGFFIATLSIIGALYALLMRLLLPSSVVPGWTFIVISVLFIGGVQIITLGILGSYIGRIFTEVQDRPLYSIRTILKSKKDDAKSS